MNNLKKIALVSVLAMSSVAANAEFIKGDWKNSGDNLSVVNTETGIEWLSLTETAGLSISGVEALLETTYEGWRLPTYQEVVNLYNTAFNESNISQSVQKYHEMMGYIVAGPNSNALGFYEGENGDVHVTGAYKNQYGQYKKYVLDGGTHTKSTTNYYQGVYLVSDGGATLSSINNPSINANNANSPSASVPVPATIGLLGLAMAGLSFRRKSV